MKRLALACAAWLACGAPAFASDASPRIWAYQYVFATSDNPQQFDPLLRHIKQEELLRIAVVLDYVAEALVTPLNANIDSQSKRLLADTLAAQGGERYRDLFQKVARDTLWPAVRSIASSYVHKHRDTTVDQYQPGTIDFARLRAEFAATALAAVPDDMRAVRLSKFPPGSTIDGLFEMAGRPHAVVSGQTTATDGLLIHIKIQRLSFYYRGVGRVVFGYRNGEGWKSQGVVVDPEAFEALLPYHYPTPSPGVLSEEALGYTQLLNGHLMAMKMALESRWRGGKVTPAFMDTTAELLLKQHASADSPAAIDVYSWMCRILVTYGGPRYANVLATVASNTEDEKLRKFANLTMTKVKASNTTPYAEGTVSLAALRAQYPALYPERRFTSGTL